MTASATRCGCASSTCRARWPSAAYGEPFEVVLEVADDVCPWNAGRWALRWDGSTATCAADRHPRRPRARRRPSWAPPTSAARTLEPLARAGRVTELRARRAGRRRAAPSRASARPGARRSSRPYGTMNGAAARAAAATIDGRWKTTCADPCSSSTTSRRSARSSRAYLRARGLRDARGRATAPRALEAVAERAPDLIVLDLMLPGHRRPRGDAARARAPDRERDHPADRQGRGVRPRRSACGSAPTTTWSSRSRPPSWSRASTPSCGASTPSPSSEPPLALRRARDRPGRAPRAPRRRGGRADRARVRPAAASSPATPAGRSPATS